MATDFFSKYSKVNENKLQSTLNKGIIEEGTGRTVVTAQELDKAIKENKEKEVVEKKVKEINKKVITSRRRRSSSRSSSSSSSSSSSRSSSSSTSSSSSRSSSSSTSSSSSKSSSIDNTAKQAELAAQYEANPKLQPVLSPAQKTTIIDKGRSILTNLKYGLSSNLNVDSSLNIDQVNVNPYDRYTPTAYKVGAYAGKTIEVAGKGVVGALSMSSLFGVGSKAVTAAKSTKAVTKVVNIAAKVKANPLGNFALTTSKVTVRGVGFVKGSEQASKLTMSKSEKEAIKNVDVNSALSSGFLSERQSLGIAEDATLKTKAGGVAKVFGYELSSLIRDKSTKQSFTSGVREELQAQGLTGQKLNDAVSAIEKQRVGLGVGETAALLDISRSSELLGRDLVGNVFKKSASTSGKKAALKVGVKSAIGIAPAGFMEGFTQEITQQVGRKQNINIGSATAMGGIGAASASILGGVISGTSAAKSKNVKKIGKVIELGAYVTDPMEKPGDLLADATQAIAKKSGRTIRNPVITLTNNNVLNFGVTESKTKTRGAVNAFTNVDSLIGSNTNTNTKTKTRGAVNTFTDVNSLIGSNTNTNTNTKTKTNIDGWKVRSPPIKINTNSNINNFIPSIGSNVITNPNVPTNTPVDTKTNIESNVPVMSNILTNVNVAIPNARYVPPVLPFDFGFGGGSGKVSKAKRKVYVNELEQSKKILKNMLGGFL